MAINRNSWFAVVLTTTICMIVGSNCTHEYIEDINGVCFEQEVLPIFQANCTFSGCHNATDREEGYDLTNYAGVIQEGVVAGDYKSSKIYKALVKQSGEEAMPPNPYSRLSDDQITTIALWIEQGAKNTAGCGNTITCDTTSVTFSGSVQPILQTYCTVCHGGSAPEAGVNLSTYAGTKAMATGGTLVGVIEHTSGYSPMPKNSNKLSACNIAKIKKWVDLGAKND